MVTAVARTPMKKQTLVICRKGGVVTRNSKFILYAKFWFQKIHSKVKKTVASLLNTRGIKAAGDKLLMNKFIRQNFGGGLTLKNVISWTFGSRFHALKLNREFGQWWKCNTVVFGLIACASLRCYELPKLRFCKTQLRVQVFWLYVGVRTCETHGWRKTKETKTF